MKEVSANVLMLERARRVLAHPDEINVLSRGQVVAMAFALDEPEYLKLAGLTMAQALGRLSALEIEAIQFAADALHAPSIA